MSVHTHNQGGALKADWRELRQGLWDHALKLNEGVDKHRRRLAWILDCRELLLTTRYLPCAGRLMWSRVRPYAPHLVGGLTMAADPLTTAVLYEAAAEGSVVGGFSIRRKRKSHGLRKLVEGRDIRPGHDVVLLDDVVSSGRSLVRAHDVAASAGARVVAAAVMVDLGRARADEFVRLGIPVHALFTLRDLGLARQPPANPTPRPRWRYPGPVAVPAREHHPGICADPDRNAIVAGSFVGSLVSLNSDGAVRWRYPDTGTVGLLRATPVVDHDRVLVGDSSGTVHCVDADSGRPLWTASIPGGVTQPVAVGRGGESVFVAAARGSRHGWLTALRRTDGASQWRLDFRSPPDHAPVFDAQRNQVIIGVDAGRLLAFRTDDLQVLWTADTGAEVRGQPALGGGLLFRGGSDGFIHAVSLSDGRLVWSRKLADRLCSTPAIAGRRVLAGADHKVIALDRNSGTIEWISSIAGRVVGGLSASVDGLVAVGSQHGELSVLEAATGRVLWRYRTGGPIHSTPVESGDLLTVSSGDGHVYAFDARACGT